MFVFCLLTILHSEAPKEIIFLALVSLVISTEFNFAVEVKVVFNPA